MKKHILLFIVITSCIASCYKESNFLCDCGKIEINKKEYIAMCIIPEEVTANSKNYLRIENHTKNIMNYLADFSMEYFNENNWVPIDLGITLDGGTIFITETNINVVLAGETEENEIRLSFYWLIENYNNSLKGRYRISKTVAVDKKNYGLVAEFEVK